MAWSIYAELLLNLRQTTICISTDPEHKLDTKLLLTSDNTILEVHHGGQVSRISLPARISAGASLDTPAQRAQEFSLRLPLAAPTQLVRGGRNRSFQWSAKTLGRTAQLLCQACGSVLVNTESIQQWKDLPHEDWAEMMDFWHCHKPEPPAAKENGFSSTTEKGYAASNRLTAQPGVGLVAMSPGEAATDGLTQPLLQCETCHAEVGYFDDRASGWRLYAWNLSGRISTEKTEDLTIPWPIATSFSAYILAQVDSHGMSKFLIHSSSGSDAGSSSDGLLLWVFNPDMYYSSSPSSSSSSSFSSSPQSSSSSPSSSSLDADQGPRRAMKVLYRRISDAAQRVQQEGLLADCDKIRLPSSTIARLLEALEKTGRVLPTSARRFQMWHVALLERSDDDGEDDD
ncbi:MAG: hypothetical protein M1815_005962 [Lichina confinis]|nr:MAG: hypothetical protein M1815_005962 [Lichina confinis]